jgi:hypothetical protein
MSVNLIKAYVKNILIALNEGVEASVTAKEMVDAINVLPDVLRNKFPDVAYPVTRGGREILPFDLMKIWAKKSEIVVMSGGDNIIFGLHLGNSFDDLLPTEDELALVTDEISRYVSHLGWYVYDSDLAARGEVLKVEIYPEVTERIEASEELYHLTDTSNVGSIMKNGILPSRSKVAGRRYGDRVYMFSNKELLDQQIEQNREAHESPGWFPKLTAGTDVSIIVVDSEALDGNVELLRDPEFSGDRGAVYTRSRVPVEAIKRVIKV